MKKIILLLCAILTCSINTFAQEKSTFSVVDKYGKPIKGVCLTIQNSSLTPAVTGKDGVSELFVKKGDVILVEAPDFAFRRIVVDKPQSLSTITMDRLSQAVDMGFGIKMNKAQSTAAISRTTSDELMRSSELNVQNALYGNALGLTALQSGGTVWENTASLSIRGLQTLSSNGVLVLVDGFDRPMNSLVREEVESVSILRDAAAVALYGLKGINGVVLVRTKRGEYNSLDIRGSYEHAVLKPQNLPKFADSYTYANALNEALRNDGKTLAYNNYELDAFKNGNMPNIYPNVDWLGETFRDFGSSNLYNISVRGGGSKLRYFTMIDLQGNKGFFKNTEENEGYSNQLKYSKMNIRTNLDVDITATTKLELNIEGIISEHNRPGRSHSTIVDNLYTVPSAAFPIKTEDGLWGGNTTWTTANPIAGLQGTGFSKSHARTLFADLKLTQDLKALLPGLSISAHLGYDNASDYWEGKTRDIPYASDRMVFDENGQPTGEIVRTTGGAVANLKPNHSLGGQWNRFNVVGTINYDRTIAEKGVLNSALIWSHNYSSSNGQHNTIQRQSYAMYNHFGWAERYLMDVTLLVGASNRIQSKNKYVFSPTASVGWVASNEEFLRNNSWLSFLKLRASAGLIHTDQTPAWGLLNQSYGGGSSYPFTDNFSAGGGFQEGRLPTVDPRTERGAKYNVGIDAIVLKDFAVSIDGYYERRSDIFVSRSGVNSAVLGVASPYVNEGIVDSKGIEVGIDYNKQIDDWTVFASGKYTFSRNKVIEMLESPQPYNYMRRTGLPYGQIFGLEVEGIFKNQAEIDAAPTQQFADVRPGDLRYKNQNGDLVIDDNDVVPMGYNSSVPEHYFSLSLGAEYKGFGFDMMFQGAANYSAMVMTKSVYMPLINNTTISDHYYANRWTPETPDAKYPRLTTESNPNNYTNNSLWLQDASFLKLRYCEIYYKFSAKQPSKAIVKGAKIYLRGMNLFSIDKMDVFDPEVIGVSYPTYSSYHAGVSVNF